MTTSTAAYSYAHGTLSNYTTGKCRCAECRSAFAEYRRKRRARPPITIERDGLFGDPRLHDRFWIKVNRQGPWSLQHGAPGQCWVWTGAASAGYGRCVIAKVSYITHRLAYRTLVGEVPDGLQLDHLCRNTRCVNPAHLEPVTALENVRRGVRGTQVHCKNGHPLSGDNLLVCKGHRTCRTCKLAYLREYRSLGRAS